MRMMTISPRTHKIIFFFFATVFLFASLAMTFHHHDDGAQHVECSLCIATDLFSSTNLEIHESFVFYPTTANLYQPEESFHQALSKFSVYSDRAPPVSISA
jgi:LSD1 subclass zinc finger protein